MAAPAETRRNPVLPSRATLGSRMAPISRPWTKGERGRADQHDRHARHHPLGARPVDQRAARQKPANVGILSIMVYNTKYGSLKGSSSSHMRLMAVHEISTS
jgi:hypothetical protein